jgi:hypothetical protein
MFTLDNISLILYNPLLEIKIVITPYQRMHEQDGLLSHRI